MLGRRSIVVVIAIEYRLQVEVDGLLQRGFGLPAVTAVRIGVDRLCRCHRPNPG